MKLREFIPAEPVRFLQCGFRYAMRIGLNFPCIPYTKGRHHSKISRKKFRQFDFRPWPARAGVATARGPRARVTGGLPDFGRRLRTNHASASKSETCSGLCMESGFWDMFKLKREAKNKIDRNLQFRITQYVLSLVFIRARMKPTSRSRYCVLYQYRTFTLKYNTKFPLGTQNNKSEKSVRSVCTSCNFLDFEYLVGTIVHMGFCAGSEPYSSPLLSPHDPADLERS